jgi:hypothetical protein
MTHLHLYEATMTIKQFIILSLAVAGCAATAYAIGRHSHHAKRQVKKRELKQDLHTWETEGGNLAPTAAMAVARPVAAV